MSVKRYISELFNLHSPLIILQISTLIACFINIIDSFDIIIPAITRIDIRIRIALILLVLLNLFILSYISKINLTIFSKTVIEFDSFLFLGTVSIFFTFVISCLFTQLYTYKLYCLLFAFIVSIILFIIRICMCKYENKTEKQQMFLKDIYENKISGSRPIVINDFDIDYDMFERNSIVEDLCESTCCTDKSFVIGVEGDWGSGKTTIINNSKKILSAKSEYIIIDDFKPWAIGSQEAMLLEMYEKIFYNTNDRKILYSEKKILKNIICEVVGKSSKNEIIKELLKSNLTLSENVNKIKYKISSYLQTNKKRIVFIIDDLDRMDSENIIFILKIIANILDIPYVSYILSYDKQRMYKVLSDYTKINSNYIEKIITKIISVPNFSTKCQKNIYSKCFNNIVKSYGLSLNEYSKFYIIENYIYHHIKNTRQFIRYINSVMKFLHNNYLNAFDLIAIKSIQFFQENTYNEIYNNRNMFISYDLNIWHEEYILPEQLDKMRKEFFAIFFEGMSAETIKLINELFPISSNFNPKVSIYCDEVKTLESIQMNYNICSNKFFELYYSYNTNYHILLGNDVKNFYYGINVCQDNLEMQTIIGEKIKEIPTNLQNEWCQLLLRHISMLDTDKKTNFAIALFKSNYLFDSKRIFMALDPRSWIIGSIADILKSLEATDIDIFLNAFKSDYKNINSLGSLPHFMGMDKNPDDPKVEQIKKFYINICKEIIDNKVNIYSDDYYSFNNAYGIIFKYNEISEKEKTNYFESIATEKTIFRILGDIVSISISNVYSYSINDKNLSLFFENNDIIDELLSKCNPKNESENFVVEIYNHYKLKIENNNDDVFEKYSISLNYSFDFDL